MEAKKNIKLLLITLGAVLALVAVIAIMKLSNNDIQKEQEDLQNTTNDTQAEIITEITASIIASAENKSEYYGKIVSGYDCINSEGVNAWKIFYADENNIYLIADDYISYEYCPSSETQKIRTYSESKYELSMDDVIKDYKGSEDITDERLKALNSDYFSRFKYTNTNNSMKALAYMLDTDVWSVFAGEKAEYAVGGPSLEMFLNSYSQKYEVDYRAKTDELGYRISVDGGDSWNHAVYDILDTTDSMYVINSKDKAYSMWLASPSCYTRYDLMSVGHVGYISSNGFSFAMTGFRPLVCLRFDVSLEKQEDGTYKINRKV